MARFESLRIKTDGATLAVRHYAGTGDPIVLLHGGPGMGDYFDGLSGGVVAAISGGEVQPARLWALAVRRDIRSRETGRGSRRHQNACRCRPTSPLRTFMGRVAW